MTALLRISPARPLLASLRCGCGARFEANVKTVPVFRELPCCQGCWDRLNRLRAAIGLPEWGRPPCYPGDYQPNGEPDAVSCQRP